MTLQKITASTVSRQLGDAGCQFAGDGQAPDLVTAAVAERGYRARQHGHNAVHVRFIGHLDSQADMLKLYRTILNNLGYTTAEMGDPTRPEGYRMLEVTR